VESFQGARNSQIAVERENGPTKKSMEQPPPKEKSEQIDKTTNLNREKIHPEQETTKTRRK